MGPGGDFGALTGELGLLKLASSFMGSSRNLRLNKEKAKVVEDDKDYRSEELRPNSSNEEEKNENDEDEGYLGGTSSMSQQEKVFVFCA